MLTLHHLLCWIFKDFTTTFSSGDYYFTHFTDLERFRKVSKLIHPCIMEGFPGSQGKNGKQLITHIALSFKRKCLVLGKVWLPKKIKVFPWSFIRSFRVHDFLQNLLFQNNLKVVKKLQEISSCVDVGCACLKGMSLPWCPVLLSTSHQEAHDPVCSIVVDADFIFLNKDVCQLSLMQSYYFSFVVSKWLWGDTLSLWTYPMISQTFTH